METKMKTMAELIESIPNGNDADEVIDGWIRRMRTALEQTGPVVYNGSVWKPDGSAIYSPPDGRYPAASDTPIPESLR